jgi:hypothetical protein
MASSFKDLLDKINDELEEDFEEESKETLDLGDDALPLSDQTANEILMHRDSHFGGKFQFMREYYLEEGIGAHPDIEIEDIDELAEFEEKIGTDIAPLSLSRVELLKVKHAQRMYDALKKIHSISQDENSIPTLLADLILTEEEVPKAEIERLAQNEKAMPYLLEILQTQELFDPIFPGYGRTPLHAAACLGKMKVEKAIIPLFESMREENFIYEEAAILALKSIGEKAFDFLLKVLSNTPLTHDNEKAAIALMGFGDNEKFAKASLKLLKEFEALSRLNLSVQLILACLGLKDKEDIESFLTLKGSIPAALGPDFQYVSSQLKRRIRD